MVWLLRQYTWNDKNTNYLHLLSLAFQPRWHGMHEGEIGAPGEDALAALPFELISRWTKEVSC